MIDPGEIVVVAVSGGPDSVALLTVLHHMVRELQIRIIVAHLDHGLRPEARDEAAFVAKLAEKLGYPCVSDRADVMAISQREGKNLEDAARKARYSFLDRVAEKHGAAKIALGHHRQDQAETVLMRIIRGSGPEGLKGMMPVRDKLYIRPLLFVDREKILSFLREQGMDFKQDETNASPLFLRNRIRHQLLPFLKEAFNPRIDDSLCRLADIVRLEDDYMEQAAEETLAKWGLLPRNGTVVLSTTDWAGLHCALRNRMLKKILEDFCPGGQGIAFAHIEAAASLIVQDNPSAMIDLPFGIRMRRRYDQTLISKNNDYIAGYKRDQSHDFSYDAHIPGDILISETEETIRFTVVQGGIGDIETIRLNPRVAFMDVDKIDGALKIRNIRPGDKFQPLGMAGNKRIKEFFIDEKVPRDRRKSLPLIVDSRSVLWVAGIRLGERVRVNAQTTRILKVEII